MTIYKKEIFKHLYVSGINIDKISHYWLNSYNYPCTKYKIIENLDNKWKISLYIYYFLLTTTKRNKFNILANKEVINFYTYYLNDCKKRLEGNIDFKEEITQKEIEEPGDYRLIKSELESSDRIFRHNIRYYEEKLKEIKNK